MDFFEENRRHNKAMEKQAKEQNKIQKKNLEEQIEIQNKALRDERKREQTRQVENQKEFYVNAIHLPKAEQFQLFISDLHSDNPGMVDVAKSKIKSFAILPSDFDYMIPSCHSMIVSKDVIVDYGIVAVKIASFLSLAYKDRDYKAAHLEELNQSFCQLGTICLECNSDDHWVALDQIPYEDDDLIDSFFESILSAYLAPSRTTTGLFSSLSRLKDRENVVNMMGSAFNNFMGAPKENKVQKLLDSMEAKLLSQLNCSDISLANIERWELHLADLREKERLKKEKSDERKQQLKNMAGGLAEKTSSVFSSLFGKK